ncbi:hypothetical protein LEMLEM_LOCUS27782 [Lemmus lemmus]
MGTTSLSRSFCQSCSCPLILTTSSCIMWFSCSVVASNWIRLTLDARALLSAFCQRTARGRALGQPFPSPVSLCLGTAPGDPQDRGNEESAMLNGRGGQGELSLGCTPGAPGLLTSMSFCFCR